MGTPLGEKMWTSNIKQIVQATVRSINLAIMNLAVCQETYMQALAETRLRGLPQGVRTRSVSTCNAMAQIFGPLAWLMFFLPCVDFGFGVQVFWRHPKAVRHGNHHGQHDEHFSGPRH